MISAPILSGAVDGACEGRAVILALVVGLAWLVPATATAERWRPAGWRGLLNAHQLEEGRRVLAQQQEALRHLNQHRWYAAHADRRCLRSATDAKGAVKALREAIARQGLGRTNVASTLRRLDLLAQPGVLAHVIDYRDALPRGFGDPFKKAGDDGWPVGLVAEVKRGRDSGRMVLTAGLQSIQCEIEIKRGDEPPTVERYLAGRIGTGTLLGAPHFDTLVLLGVRRLASGEVVALPLPPQQGIADTLVGMAISLPAREWTHVLDPFDLRLAGLVAEGRYDLDVLVELLDDVEWHSGPLQGSELTLH